MVEFGSKTLPNNKFWHLVVDLETKALEVWFFLSRETQICMKLYSKQPESFWEIYWLYLAAEQQFSWIIAPWWLSVSLWRIFITFV